ncbi:MAG: inorganic diphosphatase [Chloroflexi bacterium]|nr:MAG: inorganic diphosphatase [Chloroflexota bacterium]
MTVRGKGRTVDVVIEIPRGSRSKYEFDEKLGRLRMKRVLSLSVVYPTDYGFVPDTLATDGDPLDVLLLAYEPAVPGSVQLARPIGVLDMTDHKGPDAKVLMVPARDARFDGVWRLGDLAEHWKLEISAFFNTYKMLDGDNPEIKGWRGPAAAWKEIQSAQRAFKTKTKKRR